MINLRAWIRQKVGEVVNDDEKRFQLQTGWVFRIVAIISLVMAVVNLITGEYISILSTFLFGFVSLGAAELLTRCPQWKKQSIALLVTAVLVLFAYFIISGEPEGFSVVWLCLVPPVALLLLGRWQGGLVCLILFAMQIFLMWTPWGRSLLQYEYSQSVLLRLPLVYTAAFWVSWFLEYVREVTQKKLVSAQQSLQHLYRHDALTGVMNRYGFNELIEALTREPHPEGLALMILDLDDFKQTNDRYGHPAGDQVLKGMAEVIQRVLGDVGEVSRWGGEEFAVLMRRTEGALDMAEALRSAIAAMRVSAGSESVQATVSIGMTACGAGAVEAERLVTLTDQCLYRAKKNGKNQVNWCEYSEEE